MPEVARIRWQSPPPTSVDEELVVYDDGAAFLVVRSARDRTVNNGEIELINHESLAGEALGIFRGELPGE